MNTFPVLYVGKKRVRKSNTLAKKISKLRKLLDKLKREIEREAQRKKDRDEVRRLENMVAKSRQTLAKMRGTRSF